jgi:2-methylisocitrate lyase-like PEP mutase family enzyme
VKPMTAVFREMLRRPGIIHAPIAYDPLTARIAEKVGFRALDLGGYALGSVSCVPEPLLSLTEVVEATRRITAVVHIPLMVDGGAGYGDPLHVVRTVRELERAGAAAIHIEDQVYPKRAHYHRGLEHVIPAEEMCVKIRYALAARQDPDFVIAARTDAMITDGFAEAVRRANLYAEAGADMVMLFPNSVAEAQQAPREIRAPLIFVNSEGNRSGRPIFSIQELEDMGYKMANDAISAITVVFQSVRDLFLRLKSEGRTGLDQKVFVDIRRELEDTIGLEEYYRIEEETVERTGLSTPARADGSRL